MTNKRLIGTNIIKKRLSQRGFTLTEVIISIAITVIIATTAIFVTQAILRTSTASSDATDQATIYYAIKEYILEELRYSNHVQVGGSKPDDSYKMLSIGTSGRLTVDGEDFPYTEFFYLDNKLGGIPKASGTGSEPIFKITASNAIEVKLRITSPNDNYFEETNTIRLINIGINSDYSLEDAEIKEANYVYYK